LNINIPKELLCAKMIKKKVTFSLALFSKQLFGSLQGCDILKTANIDMSIDKT